MKEKHFFNFLKNVKFVVISKVETFTVRIYL